MQRTPSYPSDLTAPGAIDELLAFHRSVFGDARMEEAGGAGDGEGGGGDGSDGGSGGSGGSGGKATDPPSKDDGKTFTQADLDRILADRLAAEKVKHEKALKDAQDLAGKNELEKAQLEKQKAEERATEVTKAAAQRIARTEAKVAATIAGAKTDRIDAILKQTDLTGAVDDDGNVDEAKVKAAIEKTLTEYPEWKATTSTSTRSGTDLAGGGGGDKPTFTRKQIEDMDPDERVRRIDEINEALADGRVTG